MSVIPDLDMSVIELNHYRISIYCSAGSRQFYQLIQFFVFLTTDLLPSRKSNSAS